MQKIPIKIIHLQEGNYHIHLHVRLFDENCTMVLDTGASKTVVDHTSLLKIGVPEEQIKSNDILSSGLGTNNMKGAESVLPSFEIGPWKIRNFHIAVLDLSSINFAYEKIGIKPVIGIVGSDILITYGAKIDLQKQVLTLRDRKISAKRLQELLGT